MSPPTHVLAWVDYNPRSENLAAALGCQVTFMPWAQNGQPLWHSLAGWARSGWATLRLLRSLRPGTTVFVQAPPVFAPVVALLSGRRRVPVVIDIHSGAVNQRRWRWSIPLLERCVQRAAAVVVTNTELLDGIRTDGANVRVLHDPLVDRRTQARAARTTPPSIVFPASGGADEPLEAVTDAARLLKGDAEIVVTGRAGPHFAGTPARATGFLPRVEFDELLAGAAGVLALTTIEATMQRSAYEAVELGIPIVCSDTRVLREAFEGAAVFVAPDGESIAAGVRKLLATRDSLAAGASAVLDRMLAEGRANLDAIVTTAGHQQPRRNTRARGSAPHS